MSPAGGAGAGAGSVGGAAAGSGAGADGGRASGRHGATSRQLALRESTHARAAPSATASAAAAAARALGLGAAAASGELASALRREGLLARGSVVGPRDLMAAFGVLLARAPAQLALLV